jgi:PLD-like domain
MIEFIAGPQVWPRLTAAAKKNHKPAYVAVAYFGKGASKLLHLPKGSRLVVDASEHAVKAGQTHPADLKRLVTKKDVHVYTIENLHAKVFVFGSTAFVGSANVSRHSSQVLVEAMVATTDKAAVAAVRDLVRKRCLQNLGPKELDRLQRVYRPPRVPGGPRQRRRDGGRRRTTVTLRPLRLLQLKRAVPPEGSADAREAGMQAARKRMKRPKLHVPDDFFWIGRCPFRPGDVVVQVIDEGDGTRMVSPPGNVIHVKPWSRGGKRCTFVYLELPRWRRVEVKRLAKRIGYGAQKRLRRGGRVGADFAERLLAAFGN